MLNDACLYAMSSCQVERNQHLEFLIDSPQPRRLFLIVLTLPDSFLSTEIRFFSILLLFLFQCFRHMLSFILRAICLHQRNSISLFPQTFLALFFFTSKKKTFKQFVLLIIMNPRGESFWIGCLISIILDYT